MRAPLSQAASEVAEALAITSERTAPDGSPWCPPRDAELVYRWVVDRGRELGGGLRRVVRLARLLAVAEGNYLMFLHVRVPLLRARTFKAAMQAAASGGRLPKAVATVSASGVRLNERSLAPPNATAFDIDFAQMPRLAALLDVLHNALGFAPVEDLLEPVLARHPPTMHADDVARALHAKFNAWLSERLESPHYIRQAQKMRAFLAARGPVTPEAIDDEAILAFWTGAAATSGESEAEGLRLYRSSARAMLRYRRSLRDADAYRQIGAPLNLDDHLHRQPEADGAVVGEAWRSPLRVLTARPAGAVKWLTKRERLWLLNYLGGPHPDRGEPEAAEDDAPEASDAPAGETGLDEVDRFDLRFVRTLLRADVFGPVQSNLVAGLRRRLSPAAAIAQALPAVDDGAYAACVEAYRAIREQLRLEGLAALLPLLEARAPATLHLLSYLGGREALFELLRLGGCDPATLDADLAEGEESGEMPAAATYADTLERAAALAADGAPAGPLQALLAEATAAQRKVGRIGFRREDRGDAAVTAALAVGAAAVVATLRELDRLLLALPPSASAEAMAADRLRFETAFRRIYEADDAGP
jgi:hypothetical protein